MSLAPGKFSLYTPLFPGHLVTLGLDFYISGLHTLDPGCHRFLELTLAQRLAHQICMCMNICYYLFTFPFFMHSM